MPVSLALLALLVCGLASAQENPFHDSAEDIDVARATFRIYCSACHGIAARGGRGPDLTLGVYSAGETDHNLYEVIADGVPGSEMPGYGERMNSDSIWRIVAYVRSVAKPDTTPASGNVDAGRRLYSENGCAACHQIGGNGGRLGPDLMRIGRSRSLDYLREALVAPNADITSDYRTVEVITLAGEKIAGVEKSLTNFSVVLMDAKEKLHSFDRTELRSSERTTRSLMPSYEASLTGERLDDMLAYLRSLRGREESR